MNLHAIKQRGYPDEWDPWFEWLLSRWGSHFEIRVVDDWPQERITERGQEPEENGWYPWTPTDFRAYAEHYADVTGIEIPPTRQEAEE